VQENLNARFIFYSFAGVCSPQDAVAEEWVWIAGGEEEW